MSCDWNGQIFETNKEKVKAQRKAQKKRYYEKKKGDPEFKKKKAEYQREWAAANPDKIKARQEKQKQEHKQLSKEWYAQTDTDIDWAVWKKHKGPPPTKGPKD